MIRHFILGSGLIGFLLAVKPVNAQNYTVTVFPSVGPNGNGSPNIFAYGTNAIGALTSGQTSAGTPNTPAYYSQVAPGSTVSPTSIIATSTPSWNGVANPGGNFANEVGNALFFGMHVHFNTPTVPTSLAYSFPVPSNIPGMPAGTLSGNLNTGPGGSPRTYGPFFVGFNGATPIPAGSAFSTTPVTDIYFVGPSFSFDGTANGGLAGTINAVLCQFSSGGVGVGGGTFTLNGGGTGNVVTPANNANIAAPEPTSVAVMAIGVVGLLGYTYSRRRRAATLPSAC